MIADEKLANYALDVYENSKDDLGDGVQYSLINNASHVVIVVSGTNEAKDWVSNLRVIPWRDKHCGLCHSGFLKLARKLADAVYNELREKNDLGLPVYFSGHSLGGAVVGLTAIILRKKHGMNIVKVCVFGSPKPFVFGRPKVDFEIKAFENKFDPVVRTPVFYWGFVKTKTLVSAWGHSMICYLKNIKTNTRKT